jgi:hypothetical protein
MIFKIDKGGIDLQTNALIDRNLKRGINHRTHIKENMNPQILINNVPKIL